MQQPETSVQHRWFIIITVMLVTVVEVLDVTIVNTVIPDMMGALGADADQISWVLTSYVVAAGILMPMTGFLINRLGIRRLLLINIVGFCAASMLCGIATSLPYMVVCRLLQGLCGATLIPLSQVVVRNTFSANEQGKAMAIWGVGIMTGPVLGPTLGGYIADALTWRWVFYINVPFCIIGFLMALKFIQGEPDKHPQHFDWIGMGLLSGSISFLQLFLDRGNISNWFESASIVAFFTLALASFIGFLVYAFHRENTIINLRIFSDVNFTLSTLILTFFAAAIFGSIALQPMFLQQYMGYSTSVVGLAMAPRGVSSVIGMAIAGKMIGHIDPRLLIGGGLTLTALGSALFAHLTLQVDMHTIVVYGTLQGLGVGLIFSTVSYLSLSTIPKSLIPQASGVYALGRNLGTSIGISLMTTILTRHQQYAWNILSGHIRLGNPNFQRWLAVQHLTWPSHEALGRVAQLMHQQSGMLGFNTAFSYASLILICGLLFVLFLKPVAKNRSVETAH